MYYIKSFLRENIIPLAILLLYLIVYFISSQISPFEMEFNKEIEKATIEGKSLGITLMKILFFGIYELLVMLVYVFKKYDGFYIPVLVVCAFFTFSHIIVDKLNELINEESSRFRKGIVEYGIDNILGYLISILFYYHYDTVYKFVCENMNEGIVKIVAVVVFFLLFGLFAIPSIAEFAVYLIAFHYLMEFVEKMKLTIHNNVLQSLAIFTLAMLLTIIIIIVTKVLFKIVLEMVKSISLELSSVAVVGIISVVQLFVGFAVFVWILTLIF